MRPTLFMTTLLAVITLSVSGQNKDVSITGSVQGKAPTKISYRFLDNDIMSPEYQAVVDASGAFRIKFQVTKASFAYITIPEVKGGTMIVEPGESYDVTFTEDSKGFFTVSGKNDIGINLYNAATAPDFFDVVRLYKNDTVAGPILSSINTKKKKELSLYEDLAKSNSISSDFYELIKNDRDCFYGAIIVQVSSRKVRDPKQAAKIVSQKFLPVWLNVYKEYPPAQLDCRSPWWNEYATGYLGYNLWLRPDVILPGGDLREGDDYTRQQEYFVHAAGEFFSGKALETIISNHLDMQLYVLTTNEIYEVGFIPLFENFRNSYPTSKHNAPFEEYVKKIQALEAIKTASPIRGTNFISTSDPSLKQVLSQLNGKPVYVDLWATWCSFCKIEFKIVDPISTSLLKENGVTQLYISIDKKEKEETWKKMIQFYQLNGTHVLAGQKLRKDLDSLINNGKPYGIPRYLLIDKNGNVVTNNAPRLSDPANLRKALSQLY